MLNQVDKFISSNGLFLLIKKPSFLKRKCTSKKPGNIISRKKTTSRALGIGNGNRNTNAADTCRIQRRNNIFHHVRSHIVSPFCLKKCLAKKRQDKRAASRCKLLFYLSYNITEQISCQPNIVKRPLQYHDFTVPDPSLSSPAAGCSVRVFRSAKHKIC